MKKILCLCLSLCAVFSFSCCEQPQKDETLQIKYYQSTGDLIDALQSKTQTIALLSEPAVSELLSTASGYAVKLDLQELYGEIPQNIVVAKKSVIESDGAFVSSVCNGIRQGASWLKHNAHDGVEQVNHNLVGIETPVLNSYITADTVERCNISFKSAIEEKGRVQEYIKNLNTVKENTATTPNDAFFYNGESESENLDGAYTIVAPDGIPALSLAQLMYYERLGNGVGREIEYKVVAPNLIGSYLTKTDEDTDENDLCDVAVLPLLEGLKLVGSGNVYQMVGVATHGDFYIVSNQEISSINDLKGKKIGALNENQVADLTFKYLLNSNQIVYKKAE